MVQIESRPMVTATREVRVLELPHGSLALPAFLPDATRGVVRSLESDDLLTCSIDAVVMNTFHLMQRPGSSTIAALGGLHHMCHWERPIVTDSGGFQAYSLIRENPRNGTIDDSGIHYKAEGTRRTFHLTPEKCIQLQLGYGSDVLICLDDCTHADDPPERQRAAVDRTIAWALRGKREFLRLLNGRKQRGEQRPMLFAVIQGGSSPQLREECATRLLEVGFDGFGYGGWPLDGNGDLLLDVLTLTRQLIPKEFPLHALGVGHPSNIVDCFRAGYQLFDSSLPTRDARHGRLYTLANGKTNLSSPLRGTWFRYLYIHDEKHIKARDPISTSCDCPTCGRYSLGYLRHLFKIKDTAFFRLATIHNLRFMTQLIHRLRTAGSP